MNRWNVLILGLGQIGFKCDLAAPSDEVYSHARAFSTHPSFKLVGGVDSDSGSRGLFSQKYGARAEGSVSAFSREQVDVCVIATSTDSHLSCIKDALSLKPKLVVLEKPIANNSQQAEAIFKLLSASGVPCCVNYTRRFDPGLSQVGERIRAREFGDLQHGVLRYSKGLMNAASHYVDLLREYLGEGVFKNHLPGSGLEATRLLASDPEPAFILEFSGRPVVCLPADANAFEFGEIDLLFSEGRVRLTQTCSEVEISVKEPNPSFPGYFHLVPGKNRTATQMKRFQYSLAAHIAEVLAGKALLKSDFESAYATLKLCDQARSHS